MDKSTKPSWWGRAGALPPRQGHWAGSNAAHWPLGVGISRCDPACTRWQRDNHPLPILYNGARTAPKRDMFPGTFQVYAMESYPSFCPSLLLPHLPFLHPGSIPVSPCLVITQTQYVKSIFTHTSVLKIIIILNFMISKVWQLFRI
jgi:hypothetical protein